MASSMPSHRAKKGQGKRSKLKVQSDFQKRKKKLGKGKQVPENATRISFKSKSIVVPTQLEDSAIEGPTTHRKQSLQVRFPASRSVVIVCNPFLWWSIKAGSRDQPAHLVVQP